MARPTHRESMAAALLASQSGWTWGEALAVVQKYGEHSYHSHLCLANAALEHFGYLEQNTGIPLDADRSHQAFDGKHSDPVGNPDPGMLAARRLVMDSLSGKAIEERDVALAIRDIVARLDALKAAGT